MLFRSVRNRCDQRVYETEKLLREHQETIKAEQKEKLATAIAKVQDALKHEDYEAMKQAEEQLTEAWHAVSADIYAKARAQSSGGPGEAQPGQPAEPPTEKTAKDAEVVDADFEMVDDDKKK